MIEERRYLSAQIRSADKATRIVSGMAIRYDHLSESLGNFRERIAPGAFTATLRDGHEVRMLHSHDSGRILGSTKSGTLSIQDGQRGLSFRCDLPKTSDGDDVLELVRRGDLRELSFGFSCNRDTWAEEDDPDLNDDRSRSSKRVAVRTVHEARLHEISPVAWPAYAGGATSIELASARSLFPGGEIPAEIRNHLPEIDPAETQLLMRARAFLARAAFLD